MLEASKVPNRYCMKALSPDGEWVFWDARHPMNENILPCTVCMSTGMEDANGVLIYEGDIVNYFGHRTVATWKSDISSFILMKTERNEELFLLSYKKNNMHVEGNIHETERDS